MKDFIRAAAIRAVRTFAQAAASATLNNQR